MLEGGDPWDPPADPGPPCPQDFFFTKSCSFQAILDKFWAQGPLIPLGVKTLLAPLTKILDPPLADQCGVGLGMIPTYGGIWDAFAKSAS